MQGKKSDSNDLNIEIALVKFKINELENRLDEKNRSYRDHILTNLGKVLKELQDFREESAASTLHIERTNKKLDNHELRIKTPESANN